jgi:deoxyribodipyrimidine photo-lyase
MRRALMLFTCDLRVHDNAALAAAIAERDEVVPAFVLDERLMSRSCASPNRLAFLRGSLGDLDESLRTRGAGLVVGRGEVAEQAVRLARRFGAQAIYTSADTTPYASERSRRLARACTRERLELVSTGSPSVLAPGTVTPAGGGHYRVFTPYWRVWRGAADTTRLAPTPRRIPAPPLKPPRLPALRSAGASRELPDGGERAGRSQLSRFLRGRIASYGDCHDELAADATSRLSPYLHFGCISAREVLARTSGAEELVRQLCWRDFHRQVLADRPDMAGRDYRPRRKRWREDPDALAAWREGLTGYPIVDAGMRQLAREGFMHNRARLIVASLLCKTLDIDWRHGAAHFATLLCDADVANNAGNWQWVAGTGNDTRPNRVLNPLRQARRFDPAGDYVRRYVPEVADLEGRAVHEPWRLPAAQRLQLSYPPPIVDPGRWSSP